MATYDFTYDSHPSIGVVEAVARTEGIDATELTPLDRVVDPDALNGVLDATEDVRISFAYEGWLVEVDADGNIAIQREPDDASNVLVLGDGPGDCFSDRDSTEGNALLYVTFSGAPRIETASNATVVHVGHFTRGAASTTPHHPVRTEAIRDPANLVELGTTITEVLCKQESTFVCFDSIEELLQYVDLEEVFRFLHVLTTLVERESAVAHYHLDPTEERARRTLRPLFDRTVDRL